jgi:hypothetical protein
MAKIRLEGVRLTFPQLFEPKAVNGQGEPKFSASFLLAKDHPQLQALQKTVLDAATEKWAAKAGEVLKALKASDKICVHDGDAKSDYDGYAGMYYLNASNKIRPLVIGGGADGRAPLVAADGKPYSGAYVTAIVEIWCQDNQYGKRVNASLLGVQFVKDGERLAGGGTAAADDFEPIATSDQAKAASAGTGAAALF